MPIPPPALTAPASSLARSLSRAASRSVPGEQLLVGSGIEQLIDLRGVGELDLDQPTLAVRVLVDLLGRVRERLVDCGDLAGEWGDHVRDGLDRLDLGIGLVLGDLIAGLGRLIEDDLAERVSCMLAV